MSGAPRTLAGESWLSAPPTRAVMAALEAAGGADCARFVGGCVRNALTGHPVDDVDIATRLTPDQVIAALKRAGLKAVPTGVEHGTVTAVALGAPLEVTTLRRDVETDGRRAVVAFTDDWREDAQRRDFRLNALYADAGGALFDPTGEGVADALAGRIVFVGDAETSIAEDALRILRFFRFQAWYGRGAPDAAALAACAKMKALIGRLSAERISKELLKLLSAPDPRSTVRLMADTGVLDEVLPGGAALARFERLTAVDVAEAFTADPVLRLAALLPTGDPDAAAACAARLRLSNAQRERLIAAAAGDAPIGSDLSPRDARACIYRLSADTFCDRLRLAWAAAPADLDAGSFRALLSLARAWPRPRFPLTGDDALGAGAAKGPQVGAALRAVEDWWIDQDFTGDRKALKARLATVVRERA